MAAPDGASPHHPGDATGVAILRTGTEVDVWRRRSERTVEWGRYVLLGFGAVALGSGVALVLTHRSISAFVILAFGLLLMSLAAVQHFYYRRGQALWPEQMHLFPDGLELVLHNGEIRTAEWSDPHLDLEMHERPHWVGSADGVVLRWRMDTRVPPLPITAEGCEMLKKEAIRRDLQFQELRSGHGKREVRMFTFGPSSKPVPKNPADWGPAPTQGVPDQR